MRKLVIPAVTSNKMQRQGVRTMRNKLSNKAPPVFQTSEDLSRLLAGLKVKLDCGHYCTIGHNLANTLIIYSIGGGRLHTKCHNCGY
jgi:hypothetical protein